jgi:diguanylate cyclase (GGDEF)-like protein
LKGFCPVNRLIPAFAILFGWALAAWAAQPGRLPSLPVTPIGKLSTNDRDLAQRLRVHGTITYYEPGKAVVLENGSHSVWIATATADGELRIGDEADATGFPGSYNGFPTLTDGEIWDGKVQVPVAAQPATWQQLASGSNSFDLVSVDGEVVAAVREAAQDKYVFSSAGQLFTAVYSPLSGGAPLKRIQPGSKVRVTGICIPENPSPLASQASFEILLRSPDDLAVVSRPSLLSIRSPSFLIVPMLLMTIAVGAWGWKLRARVRRQAGKLAALAYLEQRRSRILADINSSKPLVEILEKITEMVAFMLDGAPCWCDVRDGARLGVCPPDVKRLRVLSAEIPSRSGPLLGVIFTGVDAGAFPGVRRTFAHEREALSAGAKLAMLAIETRRLYSDLLQRSEVDLLTNVHNRRSMEERMEALIEEARQNASVFGLIYIDLDRFKPINDRYGHHVGDLFLQEVANRMKKQLRSHDLLARLGGDEFAVLLPMVRDRTRIEEIALRLEHCFKEPFIVDGNVLEGSASFGYSMYPEDGATKESLLSAADAAMYAAKNLRKQAAAKRDGSEEPAPVDQSGR